MKRIVSSLLVFIFSALMLSQGCSAQLYGKDVLIAYLDCIVSGDYSRAFDYLGSSCRVDVDEPPLASDASTTAPTDVPAAPCADADRNALSAFLGVVHAHIKAGIHRAPYVHIRAFGHRIDIIHD